MNVHSLSTILVILVFTVQAAGSQETAAAYSFLNYFPKLENENSYSKNTGSIKVDTKLHIQFPYEEQPAQMSIDLYTEKLNQELVRKVATRDFPVKEKENDRYQEGEFTVDITSQEDQIIVDISSTATGKKRQFIIPLF